MAASLWRETSKMEFVYNDGGRAAAGYKGHARDCVARNIAIAAELPYVVVYRALALGNEQQRGKRSARNGICTGRPWFKRYMEDLGFRWTPCANVGSPFRVWLRAEDLPSGRLVVSVRKHYCAVLDGVLHDTFTKPYARVVYGYWTIR